MSLVETPSRGHGTRTRWGSQRFFKKVTDGEERTLCGDGSPVKEGEGGTTRLVKSTRPDYNGG